ncbi:MAG: TIGR04255 family protein, partial [bacterium]
KNIDSIYESIKKQYPERQEQKKSEIRIERKEGKESVKLLSAKINGYRYVYDDKKQIVQTRLDGFTLSRLQPYIKWEQLRDEAQRLWRFYAEITSPESITRVAVRYINNLKIPMPIKDFGDFLTAPPIVPEGLPQGVSSFLSRIVINEPSIDANAIITQALEAIEAIIDTKVKVLPVILDIDVFKQKQKQSFEEHEIWETLEKLRHFKNEIFFKSITDKLKEMYK